MGYGPGMGWDWKKQLERDLKADGVDMKSLSLSAGLHETAVRDLLKRWPDPRLSTVSAIARARGQSLSELIEGDTSPSQKVAVIGAASAGETWVPFDEDHLTIEMRVSGGEPIAIEVRGNSMAPVYRDGEVLIAAKRTNDIEDMIGRDCVLLTDDGARMIKFLMRGAARGRYDLRSYNPASEDIRGVRLAWAAPIVWVRRSR